MGHGSRPTGAPGADAVTAEDLARKIGGLAPGPALGQRGVAPSPRYLPSRAICGSNGCVPRRPGRRSRKPRPAVARCRVLENEVQSLARAVLPLTAQSPPSPANGRAALLASL